MGKHPYAGFLSKLAKLISNLTYKAPTDILDKTFMGQNQPNLGVILGHTKLDEDNPTLREWCLMIIRNTC